MSLPNTGRAFVKVDGQQITLTGVPKLTPAQIKRDPIDGINGLAGFKQTAVSPMLEFETIDCKSLNLEAMQGHEDLAITLELLDGRQYSITGACLVDTVEIDYDEGKVNLKFVGNKGMWL